MCARELTVHQNPIFLFIEYSVVLEYDSYLFISPLSARLLPHHGIWLEVYYIEVEYVEVDVDHFKAKVLSRRTLVGGWVMPPPPRFYSLKAGTLNSKGGLNCYSFDFKIGLSWVT